MTIATISVIIIATSIQDQPPLTARENLTMISADTDSSTLISLLYPERPPSANGVEVAVVGNGPLSHEDRQNISLFDSVVRFNDLNYMEPGENVSMRVVRHPSAFQPHISCSAPVWYVVTTKGLLPPGAALYSLALEPQYGSSNDLPADARIFSNCSACGANCYSNQTFAGPSTGAVVLSILQSSEAVQSIHVFGMNWKGAPMVHIDFRDPAIVSRCCTKCTFHPTHSAPCPPSAPC